MADVRLFGGLGSGAFERYQEGIENLQERIGGTVYFSLSGYSDWSEVASEIIALEGSGKLSRPLVLIGHSNGVYAILKIAQRLAENRVVVDYLASIDKTLKLCPPAGANIKLLHDFWAGLSKVTIGNDFVGKAGLFDLDKLDGGNVHHVEAANHPFVHDTIAKTVAELTGETHTQEPPMSDELAKMQEAATKALQPENETPAQTVFYKTFFGDVRSLWKGGLSQSSIDGMKSIIHAFDTYIKPKDYPDELLAFVLGQAYNETGGRMVPVRETLAKSDSEAMRILNAWWASGKAQKAGVTKPYWLGGFFGRGLFQETHLANYEKAGPLWEKWFHFPLDFVKTPSLFLDPVVSALSAFIGSIEGKYTGKKFADFWNGDTYDFAEARRMVNGDRNLKYRDVDGDGSLEPMGDEIGDVCEIFLKAIQSARKAADAVSVPQVPDTAEPPVTLPEPSLPDMSTIRDELLQIFPHLTEKDIETELLRLYLTRWRPSSEIAEPSPAIERGFSLPEPETKGTFSMGNYSKLIGSLVGGVVGILVAKNILPPEFNTPEIVASLTVICSAIATYIFPANQPA